MTGGIRLVFWFMMGIAAGAFASTYYLFEMDEVRREIRKSHFEPVEPVYQFETDIREACDYGYENDCPPPWSAFPNPQADEGMPSPLLECEEGDETCID